MAQSPNIPAGGNKSSGGNRGGGKSSKGSKTSSKSGKGNSIEHLANKVPAHHAHHAMSGIYDTKGKFGNWHNGMEAFKEK